LGVTTIQKAKAYLVNGTDIVRVFGDGSLYDRVMGAINSAHVNSTLRCIEFPTYQLRTLLPLFPDIEITPSLMDFVESFCPDVLRPVELPDEDYWQSLLPSHFALRPFQIECLNWIEGRRQRAYPPDGTQEGIICSLDQGLGKTAVALVWDQHLRGIGMVGKAFVICRNNNKYTTWVEHLVNITDLEFRVIEGTRPKRMKLFEEFYEDYVDIGIINYETMRLHKDELKGIDHAIIDESHRIANPKSKQSRVAKAVSKRAKYTTQLTGGAAQNRAETQLWHPLSLCDQKEWSSYAMWMSNYCVLETIKVPLYRKGRKVIDSATGRPVLWDLTKVAGIKNREQLSTAIAPYIYQKSKWDVAVELPPKIPQVIHTRLTKKQRELYLDVRDDVLEEINGVPITIALTKTLRLLQVCATLEYFDLGDESRKADEASEVMYDIVPAGHKALVFTQHVLLAGAIHRRLKKREAKALLLTGKNPRKAADKDRVREQFKTDDSRFLVTMIQLEGEGSDYPEADYVFRLDRDHRPLVNLQCEDRAHRLTSTRPVNIIDFVTRDTYEHTQMDVLKEKAENLSDVFDLAKLYTMNDIRRMLEATPKARY